MMADRSDVRRRHRYPRSDEELDVQTPRNTYEPTLRMYEQSESDTMPKVHDVPAVKEYIKRTPRKI